ncbi:hypothetical protein ACFFOS_07140, partial [Nocardioides kongjuensis]
MSETGTAWSYRTGTWFAVFGPEAAIVLPQSQKDQVVALWAMVDGGAGFDEVLDGLLASGLSRIPGFVLVSTDEGPTRFLLRGADVVATVTAAGETVTVDGGASHTWVERSLDDVTALSISLPAGDGEVDDTDFPILTGLVRVGRIDRPAVETAAAAPAPLAEPEPVAEPEAAAEPEPEPEPEPELEPEPEPEPAVESQPAPAPSLGGAHLALDEPSPLDERASAVTEAAYLDDGPATEVMDVVDESMDEPLAEAPQEPAPDGWVTPWDTPGADGAVTDDADDAADPL